MGTLGARWECTLNGEPFIYSFMVLGDVMEHRGNILVIYTKTSHRVPECRIYPRTPDMISLLAGWKLTWTWRQEMKLSTECKLSSGLRKAAALSSMPWCFPYFIMHLACKYVLHKMFFFYLEKETHKIIVQGLVPTIVSEWIKKIPLLLKEKTI